MTDSEIIKDSQFEDDPENATRIYDGGEGSESTPFRTGDSIKLEGNLILDEVIAKGGMGEVWKARRTAYGVEKVVAAKVHKPKEGLLEKMQEEVRLAIGLNHRSIARIEGFVVDRKDNRDYGIILMEYVEGTPLSDIVIKHKSMGIRYPQKLGGFLGWMMCEALQYAHEKGVIHRDIKPANIVMGLDGDPKLIDFGLAIDTRSEPDERAVTGTLRYMSPEQLRMEQIDRRTDIYSLGVTLYELLTGTNLLLSHSGGSSNPQAILEGYSQIPPSPLSEMQGFSEDISKIIGESVREKKGERYRDANEMKSKLTDFLFRDADNPLGPTRDTTKLYLDLISDPDLDPYLEEIKSGRSPRLPYSVGQILEVAKPQMGYMVRNGNFCLETLPDQYKTEEPGYLPLITN